MANHFSLDLKSRENGQAGWVSKVVTFPFFGQWFWLVLLIITVSKVCAHWLPTFSWPLWSVPCNGTPAATNVMDGVMARATRRETPALIRLSGPKKNKSRTREKPRRPLRYPVPVPMIASREWKGQVSRGRWPSAPPTPSRWSVFCAQQDWLSSVL